MTGFGQGGPSGETRAPWTEALPGEFERRFGYDLVGRLPELFLLKDGDPVSQVKWHFVELLQQLFLENFAKPIYDWCTENNLLLTGHVLHEDCLTAQVAMQGSLMRFYEYMHCPGIDILSGGNRNYWVVKQLSSVARQLGQSWLLSELYGCTGWQMSFESHKVVGDWQALFGINLRCHHLSWYTMGGEAKRDYPASILHQSGWWCDYSHVETYFARLGLMLSQGRPCCDVLVLSPVESLWSRVYPGWCQGLAARDEEVRRIEAAYRDIFFWLAGSQIDFDYADEDMLGRLGRVENGELCFGKAAYRCVVLGRMTTVRSTTLALLEQFVAAGGEAVLTGDAAQYVDALPSTAVAELAATRVPWDRESLVAACKPLLTRTVEVLDPVTGEHVPDIFCQLREDGERLILVALNVSRDKSFADVRVRVTGEGLVQEWDCETGERCLIDAEVGGGTLAFSADFPPGGEHVYVVTPDAPSELGQRPVSSDVGKTDLTGPFEYDLNEPNVCVLDMARHCIDDGDWRPEAEILKVDGAVRDALGLDRRGGQMVQPWFRAKYESKPKVRASVALAFDFEIDVMPDSPLHLCVERPEEFEISINGQPVAVPETTEWWIDVAFRKIPVAPDLLKPGHNEVRLVVPFHEGIDLEALYLIGSFGVQVDGARKTLAALPARLEIGDIVPQGLPFYSGTITYRVPMREALADGEIAVLEVPEFEAACIKVRSAAMPEHIIAWQPYEADITPALAAAEDLIVEAVLTRRNTFGPLHLVPVRSGSYGPGHFTTGGDQWSDAYQLYPSGLLAPLTWRKSRLPGKENET